MTPATTYPLNRPLPPDVAPGGESIAAFYKRYPVFSWPWIWRRFFLLSPLAIIPSLLVGLNYGAITSRFDVAIALASHLVTANLATLVFGPLLAMVIRNQPMSDAWQDRLITFVIFIGAIASNGSPQGLMAGPDGVHPIVPGIYGLPSLNFLFDPHAGWQAWAVESLSVVYSLTLGGLFALRVCRREGERWQFHARKKELEGARRQRDESNMRLAVLQAQVEPHFLFNTLASLRSLVASDPKRAADTIDALAEHLRATLPKFRAGTGVSESTLGEQFAICESDLPT